MQDFDLQKLDILFKSDQTVAIKECQRLICLATQFDSFKDFTSYHLQNSHISKCINGYEYPQSHIYCYNCSKNCDSFFCFPCFLNGNHEGHKYSIYPYLHSICSCGNETKLEPTGFCQKHANTQDDDHPDKYLDQNHQTALDTIFTYCFNHIIEFAKSDIEKASDIIKFVSSFSQFGDGFIRQISLSLTKNAKFDNFIHDIPEYDPQFILILYDFFVPLFNDQLFNRSFSKSFYSLISERVISNKGSIPINENILLTFIQNSFSEDNCRYNIENNQWDWVTFCVNICHVLNYDYFYNQIIRDPFSPAPVLNSIEYFNTLTKIQPNEQTQNFFDKMVTEVFNSPVQINADNDTADSIIFCSFKQSSVDLKNDFIFMYSLIDIIFQSFKENQNLKFDTLIEELDKIDLDPIFMLFNNSCGKKNDNDKLVSRFLIKKEKNSSPLSFIKKIFSQSKITVYTTNNYKSFENGGTFFLSLPIYDCFVSLFRVDNMSRIKLSRFLSDEKYQSVRLKVGIISLKKMLSIMYSQLINKKSAVSSFYSFYDTTMLLKHSISKIVPVLQAAIGLQMTNKSKNDYNDEFIIKEFFAFESAREIGLFDDTKISGITDLTLKKLFVYLYSILLIVLDRNNFNFDVREFIKEQIVFALKFGDVPADKLSKCYDIYLTDTAESCRIYNELVEEVATTKKIQRGSYYLSGTKKVISYADEVCFSLKDKNDWKSISGIIPINHQYDFIDKEMNENMNDLLKIPKFEQENISFFKEASDLSIVLKDLLVTPSVLAIVYHTLLISFMESKVSPVTHLAMNILVLIYDHYIKPGENQQSKNIQTLFNGNTTIKYVLLADLIIQFKRIVFNSRIDEDGYEFIENTLSCHNFEKFLQIKIKFNQNLPMSFIDLLHMQGSIGEFVLEKMNLIKGKWKQAKEESSAIKNPIQNSFNDKNDNDNNDNENNDNENNDNENNDNENNDDDDQIVDNDNGNDDDGDAGDDDDLCATSSDDVCNINGVIENIKNYINIPSNLKNAVTDANEGMNKNEIKDEYCRHCFKKKENEILLYPLYLYRTKFPFIVDKPPLTDKDSNRTSVDDNKLDFGSEKELVEYLRIEFGIHKGLSQEDLFSRTKEFGEMMKSILLHRKLEKDELSKNGGDKIKRVTNGANFVVQFGMSEKCFHKDCLSNKGLNDLRFSNCELPNLVGIPEASSLKDLEALDVDVKSRIQSAVQLFINQFTSFFTCTDTNEYSFFIEIIKSLSGLIVTYEIRLRNLKDSLNSLKSKILPRNLYITAWYSYRILKNDVSGDVTNLTDFQKFIKELIECNEIDQEKVKNIALTIINSMENRSEKEICLFLRRVCLAEYFLLGHEIKSSSQIFKAVKTANLSKRYGFHFTLEKGKDFTFKEFVFSNLPHEFIYLREKPFDIPIDEPVFSFFSLLEYNFLVRTYSEDDDEEGRAAMDESEALKNQWALMKVNKIHSKFIRSFYGKRQFPSVLLITVNCAQQIAVVDQSHFTIFEPFYTDRFGCPDATCATRQPLYLNDEMYKKFMDLVLSGDFALFF